VQAIEEPFLLAVKETLDDRCTRRVETLFKKTIRYILTLIVIGFRQTRRPSTITDTPLSTPLLTTSSHSPLAPDTSS